MNSSSSSLLGSAAFTQTARAALADGLRPAPVRANASSQDASDRFSTLMKSYAAGQATPAKPEGVGAAGPDAALKPAPAAPAANTANTATAPAPSQESKAELQRQEKKLSQKKIASNEAVKARTPSAGVNQQNGSSSAAKFGAEKTAAAQTDAEAQTASSALSAQAARAKQDDLVEQPQAPADANAALAQQTSAPTAALGNKGACAADAGTGLDLLPPGSADGAATAGGFEALRGTAADPNALEFAGRTGVGALGLPYSAQGALGQGRVAAQHQQSLGAAATQQAQTAAAGGTDDATLSPRGDFAKELLAAQGGVADSLGASAAPRIEGLALEGMLSAMGAAAQAPVDAKFEPAEITQLTLSPALTEASFAPEMAARLSVLAADGVQEARLHLNPAEMGPVSVQIIVEGQQAQVSFHAEQAETRHILEQSLPDLAAALRDAGLTLSGGGVFQQPGEQSKGAQADADVEPASAKRIAPRSSAELASAPMPIRQGRGVVDLYA